MLGALATQRGNWCNAELLIEEKLFKPPDLLAEAVAMYRYLCATKRFPKTWPKPPVSNKAPALYQTSLSKPDQLPSNAQRAPEVFSSWQSAEATTAGARFGDVGLQNLLNELQERRCAR